MHSLSMLHLLAALPAIIRSVPYYVLMIVGFGFVVFFHELGHFLAAKAVGIRAEQFAVGFGQALISWRKGMGFKFGSSGKQYDQIIESAREQGPEAVAAAEKKYGETEYRINWIPLGGYVKMLGQDDLKPGAGSADPRSFTAKSVGKRMIVVSAGVIMNVILAAIGFIALFRLLGFNAPPPVVGTVQAYSPAQQAGLMSGDRIVSINGYDTHDWMGVILYTALVRPGNPVDVLVDRPQSDGTTKQLTLNVTPRKPAGAKGEFQMMGVGQSFDLRGPDAEPNKEAEDSGDKVVPAAEMLKPGDRITAINGRPVGAGDGYLLVKALQESQGQPVEVTILGADGKSEQKQVQPHFEEALFTPDPINVAGMQMQPVVERVLANVPASGKLEPGDVIESIRINTANNDLTTYPTGQELIEALNRAHSAGATVTVVVQRKDATGEPKEITVSKLAPTLRTSKKPESYGVGIQLIVNDDMKPLITAVVPDSPAAAIKDTSLHGALIESVDGQPVANWFDVRRDLMKEGEHTLAVRLPDVNQPRDVKLTMSEADVTHLRQMRFATLLNLPERLELRKTDKLLTATHWGLQETRDFILQFYVTIARMVQGDISVKNMMGPIGMASAGANFARRGTPWLVWFLAMISANLAVVNFLPIPIVDGGLFTFLIIEKIKGKPLSERTQTIAQVVGLVLIGAVFILVTYQDFARMF